MLRKIAGLLLGELQKRCQGAAGDHLEDQSCSEKAYIAEKGFDEKYGARPLRRAVQNQIEDVLAEEILSRASRSAGIP